MLTNRSLADTGNYDIYHFFIYCIYFIASLPRMRTYSA